MRSKKRRGKSAVAHKISKLKKEGYGHRQAVAIALSMRDRERSARGVATVQGPANRRGEGAPELEVAEKRT